MQAELIERDLSYQVTTQVEQEARDSKNGLPLGNVKLVVKMDEVELEQFVRTIAALGDCV